MNLLPPFALVNRQYNKHIPNSTQQPYYNSLG